MQIQKRIVALDVGDVKIGVAVSDVFRITAQPIKYIRRIGYGPDVKAIKEICDQYNTDELLLGLPLLMNGQEGEQAKKTKGLAQQLINAGLKVKYSDERLTTVSAHKSLIEGGMRREQRHDNVDKIAAALILQSYLDINNN